MKVIYSKNKYICSICKKSFFWNKQSRRYGKMEYETKKEKELDVKYFCSSDCVNKFKNS